MKLAFAALAAAAALAPSTVSTAKCMRTELAPVVLTKADSKLPSDGGILVGWENSTTADETKGDPSVQAGWTATAGGKPAALTVTTLAPGLTVYTPAKPVAGKYTLADAKHKGLVTVVLGTTPADAKTALAAPKVTHVVFYGQTGRNRFDTTSLVAAVESVPDAAVALIIYSQVGTSHAASFGLVAHDKQGATTVLVVPSQGHCGRLPAGTEAVPVGAKTTFAWVDAAGHVSPQSPAIVVEAAPKSE